MESQSNLLKISSKYIFDKILDYIEDRNFILKLLRYSKSLQKKFEIKLSDYQFIRLGNINFYLDYLLIDHFNLSSPFFSKNCFKNKKNDLFNDFDIDKNIYGSILANCVEPFLKLKKEKYYKDNKDSSLIVKPFEEKIDIYSKLFDELIKKDFEYFSIIIPINLIKDFNLTNDFKNIFDKMNKLNINYSSLTIEYIKDNKDLLTKFKSEISNIFTIKKGIDILLKSLNIKFDKIKRLTCIYENFRSTKDTKKKNENFFKSVLSCFVNKNNLIHLDLDIFGEKEDIDIINDLVSLKTLYLNRFELRKRLVLNLPNLEQISLFECKNIFFDEKIWPNIKYLYLRDTCIQSYKLCQFPNLISLTIEVDNKNYNKIIDFSSLEKLENFFGYKSYILDFKKTSLKNMDLYQGFTDSEKDINKFTQIIEKIISIKTLKKIDFELLKSEKDYIIDINGENNSVTDLKIEWNESESDCILYNIQKKFPNLSSIIINTVGYSNNFESPTLEINEDEDCKINRINIKFSHFNKSIKLCCQSFENLIELKLIFIYNDTNICLEKFFTIFDEKSKIIFRSLKTFSYTDNFAGNLTFDEINKINFNCMPNLNNLTINCRRKKINYSDFIKEIEKLLLLCIKNIELKMSPIESKIYSISKLKELFPNINFNKYLRVSIEKYLDKFK